MPGSETYTSGRVSLSFGSIVRKSKEQLRLWVFASGVLRRDGRGEEREEKKRGARELEGRERMGMRGTPIRAWSNNP